MVRKNGITKYRMHFGDAQFLRLAILFIVILLGVGFSKNWKILSGPMVNNMLYQMPEFGLISLGIMLTRISGRIDLSVVGTANLSAIIATLFLRYNFGDTEKGDIVFVGILGAFIIALLCGSLCGSLNAFLIYKLDVPAFVATIGTGTLYSGIGLIMTKGTTLGGLPHAYQQLISMRFGFIPLIMLIYILCAIMMAFLLYKTRFGLNLYLSGTSMLATRYAGINEFSVIFKPYIIAGCMSALGGMIMLGRFNSVNVSNGNNYALMGVLICMIGGINPSGGQGRVENVVMATLTIQLINSSLSLFHSINTFYNNIILGGLLIFFMIFNYYIDIRQEHQLNKKVDKTAE